MPWQNNGDYYSFKQDSITQHAPTVSGVYGLFNFRHLVVIASAANVRDALLHHRRHTKFRFSRFKPTGFTFEICPPERRDHRAQELIKEYNPISSPQSPIGIAALCRSWRAPQARAFKSEMASERKLANHKILATSAKPAKAKPPLHLKHLNAERFGLAGALCGVIFLTIGLIGLVPHLKNKFETVVRNPAAIAESKGQLGGGKMPLAPEEPSNSIETTVDTVVAAAPSADLESASVKLNGEATISSPTDSSSAAAQAVSPVALATPKPQTVTGKQAAKRAAPTSAWSVQALASTDKELASDWLQRLKAKGYEAFIVDANINGNTWHRLRIGTFEIRQDAENLRLELKAKEGFKDAFVAGIEKPATTIALNRR